MAKLINKKRIFVTFCKFKKRNPRVVGKNCRILDRNVVVVGSQFLPPTSQTTRGSYVLVLHNISHPAPQTIIPSGHTGLSRIGPALQPPTLAWVPPQQPNIGNQYLSGA